MNIVIIEQLQYKEFCTVLDVLLEFAFSPSPHFGISNAFDPAIVFVELVLQLSFSFRFCP